MLKIQEELDPNEKIIVITGATGGIGFEVARVLATSGANILVTGRNIARGNAAEAQMRRESRHGRVWFLETDHASMAKNLRFASKLEQTLPRIDVLLNNAGALMAERQETDEGFELTMAVNHFAPFVLTYELLSLLRASQAPRVLNVTGGAPPMAKLPLHDLEFQQTYLGMEAYNTAKLASMAVSLELGRRLAASGVPVHVVYPGGASTAMTQNITPSMLPWYMRPGYPLMKWMMHFAKADNAAKSVIWAATTTELDGRPPTFVQSVRRFGKVPPRGQDPKNIEHLWHWTLDRLGFSDEAARVRLSARQAEHH